MRAPPPKRTEREADASCATWGILQDMDPRHTHRGEHSLAARHEWRSVTMHMHPMSAYGKNCPLGAVRATQEKSQPDTQSRGRAVDKDGASEASSACWMCDAAGTPSICGEVARRACPPSAATDRKAHSLPRPPPLAVGVFPDADNF